MDKYPTSNSIEINSPLKLYRLVNDLDLQYFTYQLKHDKSFPGSIPVFPDHCMY